jgi:hypothetical protein
MNRFCFFSSDARPLYKQDVFRAMSYPKGYVIHFRYQEKYVVGNPNDIKNKEGVIFFSMGNNLNTPEPQRVITHVSVREVKVQEVEIAEDTGQIHFYLELGNFKMLQIEAANSPAIMPPHKFVTELKLNDAPIAQWYQVVDSIKTSFPSQLFYKFQIRDKEDNSLINPLFEEVEKQSYYKLSDEKSYALDMAFYDTELNSSNNYHGLKIEAMDGGLIQLVVPETINLDARKDNRVYSMFTKTASSKNAFTYINFSTLLKSISNNAQSPSTAESSVIDTTLKIKVEKSLYRSIAFAGYTILAASVLVYSKLLSDKVDLNGSFSWTLALQFMICICLGFLAAIKLYMLFDKK